MKTDDDKLSGAQPPFDDDGLSRLHRAYSTEIMPPEVTAAVLAAARRLARSGATSSGAIVAVEGESETSAHNDDDLSRLHRAYSLEKAPAAMNEAVLAAAARLTDSFHLLAAASDTGSQATLCRSISGLLTLEVFVGKSEQDRAAGRGHLLLTVDPDHHAAYEGRIARVFVKGGTKDPALAEGIVRNGELYVAISLSGLALQTKDAVNVVFGPAPDAP